MGVMDVMDVIYFKYIKNIVYREREKKDSIVTKGKNEVHGGHGGRNIYII